MLINITIPGELRQRRAPRSRVRLSTSDIARNRRAWKEPDGDSAAGPFGGVYSTAVTVESVAIRLRGGRVDPAAGVRGLSRRVDVAVASRHRAGETAVVDGAAGARV